MRSLIVATLFLLSCAPVSSAPGATPTASGAAVIATAGATPSPTATVAPGLTRYVSTELGYSVDLPPGWRRAVCSAGVIRTSPLLAAETFLPVPEAEEYITGGVRMAMVRVAADQGLTPVAWLERDASQPDARFEPVTLGGRMGARGFIGTTGHTVAFAFAARGWIYAIDGPYFGTADQELERILASLRILDDATVSRGPSPAPTPRSIESVVDSVADGFARKDVAAIAGAMTPCVSAGAVPGDPSLLSRTAYLNSLAANFAAGTSVAVQPRPIESDPNFGRFVRSTWSKPGQPDQRVDLLFTAAGDRWSLAAVLFHASPN